MYVPPLTNVSVSGVIPLTGLYSTSPVLLFLTNISVAELLSVGVVVKNAVCADNTPFTIVSLSMYVSYPALPTKTLSWLSTPIRDTFTSATVLPCKK